MAAAVDLSELIGSLKATINVPGENSFPNATEADWLANLQNGFWDAMVDGIIPKNYTEDGEGIVTPDSGDTPLSRELQQVIVFYAGSTIVSNQIGALNTVYHAKAGPVEIETQQSAQVLKNILDGINERLRFILMRLSDSFTTKSYYIDVLNSREASMSYGDLSWVGSDAPHRGQGVTGYADGYFA